MAVKPIGNRNNRFIGLSTDTKPTDGLIYAGATFYESNTGILFIYDGVNWLPKPWLPDQSVNYKQISLAQAAAAYDVMTATTQNVFIDAVVVSVPTNLSAVATFTGISVATDDTSAIEIMAAAAGVKAKLLGNFVHVFRGPRVSAATKDIQLTIGGGSAGTGTFADITVFWRPVVAGGYYLNA